MRIAITGTPGTGKTTCSKMIETKMDIVHLNEIVKNKKFQKGFDESRQTAVVDIDSVRNLFDGRDNIIIESHISHLLDVDKVIILRCRPDELERRLISRNEISEVHSKSSIKENIDAEALDVILFEALEMHGEEKVYEIEGSDKNPEEIVQEMEAVILGDSAPNVGIVSYIEYLFDEK